MGYRGYYGYIYEGRYFKKYDHWYSYPRANGVRLMSYVPEDPEEFKRWLERARAIIASFDEDEPETEEEQGASEHTQRAGIESDSDSSDVHQQFYQGLRRKDFEFSETSPHTDLTVADAVWAFIYNLDYLAFSIEVAHGAVHFRLDNLPRGYDTDGMLWIEKYIYLDPLLVLCRAPFTPAQYCVRLVPAEPLTAQSMEDVRLFEESKVQRIEPSVWEASQVDRHTKLSRRLAVTATEALISSLFSQFTSPYVDFDEPRYIAYAKELLTCASPGFKEFGDTRLKERFRVSDNGTFHWEDTVDLGPRFWFRGCLVVLTSGLDCFEKFKSTVGMVIRHANKSGLEQCTAILWSMEHVAVVSIEGDIVSCSDAIGVVAAFGRDDIEFKRGLGLIAHYLQLPCSQGGTIPQSHLAFDILLRIMDFADSDSAEMLGRTCKALRLQSLKRPPSIGPFTLLSVHAQDDDLFIATTQELETANASSPLKLSISYPRCIPYLREGCEYGDSYCEWFYYRRTRELDKEETNYIYGPEKGKVASQVCPKFRFIDNMLIDDYMCSNMWRWHLVVVEAASLDGH